MYGLYATFKQLNALDTNSVSALAEIFDTQVVSFLKFDNFLGTINVICYMLLSLVAADEILSARKGQYGVALRKQRAWCQTRMQNQKICGKNLQNNHSCFRLWPGGVFISQCSTCCNLKQDTLVHGLF